MAQVQLCPSLFPDDTSACNPNNCNLVIYSDNLMHTGPDFVDSFNDTRVNTHTLPPHSELEAALTETLDLGLDFENIVLDPTSCQIQIKDLRDNRDLGTFDFIDDLQVTAKLFFNEYLDFASVERFEKYILDAISLITQHLKVGTVHRLILSFPNITSSVSNQSYDLFQAAFIKLLAKIEKLHSNKLVENLGVADFSFEQLRALQLLAPKLLPNINQINVSNAQSIDTALVDFCSSNSIELLAHKDSYTTITSNPSKPDPSKLRDCSQAGSDTQSSSFNEIPLLSSQFFTNLKKSNYFKLIAPKTSNTMLPISITPSFVIKYTAIIKNRSIIRSKGYISSLQSQF
ncbi:hypothetical protein BB561_002043 [Smittium simulii]|uniref:GCS light chain n=1 Tax=Smittium simulii TaxID=133385 RepID=A0A2T9YRZ2_9FUNG|nr:hypothetical protein BB561_002043 [Smittium simulii]